MIIIQVFTNIISKKNHMDVEGVKNTIWKFTHINGDFEFEFE